MNQPAARQSFRESVAVARPTRVRWRIIGLLLVCVALSHFNRLSITVAGDERLINDPENPIDSRIMGAIYSSYLVAYTLCMVPAGLLIDRLGPRRTLILMGVGSALFGALTGVAGRVATAALLVPALFLARLPLGAVSSPIHPASARMVSYWAAVRSRAGVNGLVTAAACVGISSTYLIFGWMMDEVGWPNAFIISGAVTMAVAILWAANAADRPAQHPAVNPQEVLLIEHEFAERSKPLPESPADARPLLSQNLFLLTLSYGALGYVQYLVFYWVEHYFKEKFALSAEVARLYASLCTLSMGAGMILGGHAADRFQRALGFRGRALVPFTTLSLCAVLLCLGAFAGEPMATIVLFCLAMAGVGAAEGPFWTTAVELGGWRGGTSAAILNTGGNGIGLLAPVVTPIVGEAMGWTSAIVLGSLFALLGGLLWLGIHPAGEASVASPG